MYAQIHMFLQQEYNEQIQHEAVMIITIFPKFSILELLYFETRWEPLQFVEEEEN
jgi:hypothetical protein